MHCVNIALLKDGVDEADEYLLVNLVLKDAPFDIPLDRYNSTIIDSGEPRTIMLTLPSFLLLSAELLAAAWKRQKNMQPTSAWLVIFVRDLFSVITYAWYIGYEPQLSSGQ